MANSEESSFKNIQSLWFDLVESHPDRPFLSLLAPNSDQVLAYKTNAFFKRAYKIAAACYAELELNPGDRVAVLCESSHDYAMIMHSCWIAKLVPVPLSLDFDDNVLVGLLNNCNVKTVIFEPSASARVASIYTRTFSVKNWIVTGKHGGQPEEVRMLDDIVRSASGEELPEKVLSYDETLGLIILTGGTTDFPRGVSFSQRQLLAAAKAAQCFYPKSEEGSLVTSLLPLKSIYGITHSLLGSLLNDVPCLLEEEFDLGRFWEKIHTSGVSDVQLSQDQLREVNKKGKPKSWMSPGKLRFHLTSSSPFSSELLATFEKRFGLSVLPSYSLTEAGGVVSCFPLESNAEYLNQWLYDYYIPSSGLILDGVEVKIVNHQGAEVRDEVLGEIVVRSDWVMQGYSGTTAGDAYFGQKSFLHTGDEGFIVKDEQGASQLFVTGRIAEMIQRNNLRINPAKIDGFLYEIKGVEFACTIGFPNVHTGFEVGVYIMPKRGSQLTKSEIKVKLRDCLDWVETPKVIVLGEPGSLVRNRPRSDFVSLFEDYKKIDFSVVQEV